MSKYSVPERADARAFAKDARTVRAAARRTDAGFAKDAGPSSRAETAGAAKDGENVTPPTTETRSAVFLVFRSGAFGVFSLRKKTFF